MDWVALEKAIERYDFASAVSLLTPEAELARKAGELQTAIELTLQEAHMLSLADEADLAYTRATWALARLHQTPQASSAQSIKREWLLDAFDYWIYCALEHQLVPLVAIESAIDRLDAMLDPTDHYLQGNSRSYRGSLVFQKGQYEEAVQRYRSALSIYVACEADEDTVSSLKESLALALMKSGSLEEATELLLETLPDNLLRRAAREMHLARFFLMAGQLDQAVVWADRAVRSSAGGGVRLQGAAYGTAVECWIAVGRLEDAQRAVDFLFERARDNDQPLRWSAAHLDAFDLARARMEHDAARRHLDEAERYLLVVEAVRPAPEYREYIDARRSWLRGEEE